MSAASSSTFDMANEISQKTPNLCHLAPAGNTYMEDLERAGGVYAVMAELAKAGLLDTGLHDLHRQDGGREPGGRGQPGSGDHPPHRGLPTPRPAASPC